MAKIWDSCGDPVIIEEFNKLRADVAELRTQLIAVLAKLDAENVTNMDTDYESTLTPAALTSDTLTR